MTTLATLNDTKIQEVQWVQHKKNVNAINQASREIVECEARISAANGRILALEIENAEIESLVPVVDKATEL